MTEFVIRGGRPLSGETVVQGAKNSILPLLAAAVTTAGVVELENCPHLRDVEVSIRILRELGAKADWDGDTLRVDSTHLSGCAIPESLMREMRSSAVYLGALLTRCHEAVMSYPGGCELGPRPIDLHLSGLRALGAEIREEGGELYCRAAKLQGCTYILTLPSVGATEDLMLAAVGAEGRTAILGAAREPEIVDLQNFLRECGAEIYGAGTSTVVVEGGKPLHGCRYRCMPDRIVTATYLSAAAAAGGDIFLRDARGEDLEAVIALLRQAGCEIRQDTAGLRCTRKGTLRSPGPVRTAPYPGFPTDAQAPVMAALCLSRGVTVFEENIFESRYRHVDELRRMGADIRTMGRVAVVNGVEHLSGAAVRGTDLRGGAALCAAGLGAQGETRVSGVEHIDRGYADLAGDLTALGGDVERQEETKETGEQVHGETETFQSTAEKGRRGLLL